MAASSPSSGVRVSGCFDVSVSQVPDPRSPAHNPFRRRRERIYPWQAPIAEGEREYTRGRHQSQKGRENIPVTGTNRRRGERIYPW
eukprot:4058921-Pyramimonas_sp.AAC.1